MKQELNTQAIAEYGIVDAIYKMTGAVCDNYCKYREMYDDESEELEKICDNCPLTTMI